MRLMWWFTISTTLVQVGCGKHADPQSATGQIEANAVRLNWDGSGAVLKDDLPITPEQISEWGKPQGAKHITDPILLKVPSTLAFEKLHPLLTALMEASRVNIGFQLLSEGVEGVVKLPVTLDHGCHELRIFTGSTTYDEHEKSWKGDRLWVKVRPGPLGSIVVESVQVSKSNPDDTVIMDSEGNPRSPTAEDFRWAGKRPPLGHWETETLRQFLGQPEVSGMSPVCTVTIRGTDTVGSALSCLRSVQSVASPRVMAALLRSDRGAPEDRRAFRQEREADLVVQYDVPSDLPDILPPSVRTAVVIFSKRADWDDALMDRIEAKFRAQGCGRVIFQVHQGKKILGEPDTGRPILRE
jgi:hypothetical protein